MVEDDEAGADDKRGRRDMEWKRDDRQQRINNQPGGNTDVKAKAAWAVNTLIRCCVYYGGSRKVSGNGREAVDNRQQWQRQSGNNQIKVTVANGVVDSHGGGGGQRRLRMTGGKMPTAKAIIVVLSTPLLLSSARGHKCVVAAAARE